MGSVDDVPSRRGRLSPQHGDRAFTFITPSGLLAKGLAHMLHSLVRVSRRVGRGRPNTSSTGAQVTLSDRGSAVTVSTARSPPSTSRPRREAPPYGVHHTGQKLPSFLGRSGAPGSQSISCRASKLDPTYRPSSLVAPLQPPLVRAREEYGSASGGRLGTLWYTQPAPLAEPEPAQSPHQPRSFPSQRFHVLFDSLFKVLFIFPSRYLFAIGLVPVFSFRWSLPPILGCNPKQPDSSGTDLTLRSAPAHGALTLSGPPFQDDFGDAASGETGPIDYNSPVQAPEISNLSCSRFARRY